MVTTTSTKSILNTHNVLKSLQKRGYNQYDIAAKYISGFKGVGQKIKSDLRTNDKLNSLSVMVGQSGDIIVSDFGYKTGMTIFEYVSEKYFGLGSKNYILALDKIRQDFGLTDLYQPIIKTPSANISTTYEMPVKHNMDIKPMLPTKIEIKGQRIGEKIHWNSDDLYYWKQYGISKKKLEEKNIIPLEAFWLTNYTKDGIRQKYDTSNILAYAYPFQLNEFGQRMYKIYMPYGFKNIPDFRWVSNTNKYAVQNLFHIPKQGELLIIQSSYKDIMCMEEMNDSICAVAPPSECIWFDDKVWDYFKQNWKYIVIFGNNDSAKEDNSGLKLARKHSLKYAIPFILPPDNTTSDISDYYLKYGEVAARHLLDKSLSNVEKYLLAS